MESAKWKVDGGETEKQSTKHDTQNTKHHSLLTNYLKVLALLLAPFAPFMTEEAWVNILAGKYSIHRQPWPEYNPKLVIENTVTIAVQVNGKLRTTVVIQSTKARVQGEVIQMAKEDANVKKWLEGKDIEKGIFVPGRLLNFVVA